MLKKTLLVMIAIRLLLVLTLVSAKPIDRIHDGYLFQGDMLFRRSTYDIAVQGGDVDKKENKIDDGTGPKTGQTAAGLYAAKWENGVVPYKFGSKSKCYPIIGCLSFTPFGRPEKAIKSAMKEWEEKTCIRFKPRENERDYIEFINEGFGKCYSFIGRVTGKQVLSLATGCGTHGIALHELGHALGLHHEQSRPDRDDYVTVNYDNIQKGTEINFKKYSFSQVNGLGQPYDYGSIMHYSEDAFGKWPWSTTITPKKKGVEIGQRKHLSTLDAATINKLYNCKK